MNGWKRMFSVLLALTLLACCAAFPAAAEGAAPHGDGNGIVSRQLLASLYKWMNDMDGSFRQLLTFDEISAAVGKPGSVKDREGDTTRAAYWTDGNAFVTVTFKNRDGYWGVTAISTGLPRDEYDGADISFLPRVGNREAGSSAAAPVTLTTQVKNTREDVAVTAEVPAENWFPQVSFGEIRFQNAASSADVSGNSAGMRISFWPDEASLLADQAAGEGLTEADSLYLLGMEMPGCTYTRYGMKLTDYTAKLSDDLLMRVTLYKLTVYEGSEAEAILKSLKIEKGDFSFSYQPLNWDTADEPGGSFLEAAAQSGVLADGGLYIQDVDDLFFVYNDFSPEFLSFTHAMESENYYSYADFDVVVLHAGETNERAILRLWMKLWTDGQPADISSVTFTTGGKSYTFTELSDPEDFQEDEGDYGQTMLIRFDQDSLPFLVDLDWNRMMGEKSFQAVFHGTEDIETELSDNFYEVFSAYWTLYFGSDAENSLDGYHGNPMSVEE